MYVVNAVKITDWHGKAADNCVLAAVIAMTRGPASSLLHGQHQDRYGRNMIFAEETL